LCSPPCRLSAGWPFMLYHPRRQTDIEVKIGFWLLITMKGTQFFCIMNLNRRSLLFQRQSDSDCFRHPGSSRSA
ncbi:MAG: hypothetical protein PVG08_11325, partial [Desulfobacterales bacterium]